MIRSAKRLGEILIGKGLISPVALNDALNEQRQTKEFLGTILLKRKLIEEQDFLGALSEQFGIPVLVLKNKYIDWNFVRNFSASLILDYRCFPVSGDDWSVTIAITNPLDSGVLKKAEEEARGLKLKIALVSEEDMQEVTQRYKQYMRAKLS